MEENDRDLISCTLVQKYGICSSQDLKLVPAKGKAGCVILLNILLRIWGTQWRSWLSHCVTSRNVAGSIPDNVIGIFLGHIPSGRIMALWLTQPLTAMSTRSISWGKDGRCVGLTTLHLHVPIVMKSGSLNLLETSGPIQACNGVALLASYVRGRTIKFANAMAALGKNWTNSQLSLLFGSTGKAA
jgi:hypothetical protein